MILLAFFGCFLVFIFFVKDQIASFQLKQIVVFSTKCSVCYICHCVIATEFDY